MRTIIQVYMKNDELTYLAKLIRGLEKEGMFLIESGRASSTDEYVFIFERKEGGKR